MLLVVLAMFYDGCLLSDPLYSAGVVAQPASGWLAHATRVASETVTDVERPGTRRTGGKEDGGGEDEERDSLRVE